LSDNFVGIDLIVRDVWVRSAVVYTCTQCWSLWVAVSCCLIVGCAW